MSPLTRYSQSCRLMLLCSLRWCCCSLGVHLAIYLDNHMTLLKLWKVQRTIKQNETHADKNRLAINGCMLEKCRYRSAGTGHTFHGIHTMYAGLVLSAYIFSYSCDFTVWMISYHLALWELAFSKYDHLARSRNTKKVEELISNQCTQVFQITG